MTIGQVVFAILSLLFGGVAGAFAKYLFDQRQNRVQVINAHLHITPIDLKPKNVPQGATVNISVHSATGTQFNVDTLYAVELALENTTNKDLTTFDFGVTFPKFFYIIDEKVEPDDPQDRFHTAAVISSTESVNEDHHERDFRLTPFTRGDRYTLRYTLAPFDEWVHNSGAPIYLSTSPEKRELSKKNFAFGTPETGVRFGLGQSRRKAQATRHIRVVMGLFILMISTASFSLIVWFSGNIFTPPKWIFLLFAISVIAMVAMRVTIHRYEKERAQPQED